MKQGFEHLMIQEMPPSLELAHQLEETDDDELIREKLGLMLQMIEQDLGVDLVSNMNDLYKGMQSENCLVRTERLSRVLETVELEKPLKISDDTERHYANAALPNAEGIKIAFSEGQAPGPIRIMVGFGKTIVGFKTENVKVNDVDFNASDIRDPNERKYVTRHVTGELSPDDIRYVVMRIPAHFMKDEYLTDEEKTKKPRFIFRGARLHEGV